MAAHCSPACRNWLRPIVANTMRRAAQLDQDAAVVQSPSVHSPTSPSDMNRVHEELEKLNIATDVINKLELQLDEAQAVFRDVQSSWTQRLAQMAKRLGGCIEKSRPYYEARIRVLEAQQEAHKAALRFERANRMHAVAKQQVSLTQDSLNRQGTDNIDPACLEVLNHHVQRVNEAEVERLQSEEEHRNVSRIVEQATRNVFALENSLKRSIQKSKSYFEARVEFTKVLQNQKSLIQRLEAEIRQKKADYNGSLRQLERISEEIHEKRSKKAAAVATLPSRSSGTALTEDVCQSTAGVNAPLPDVCLGLSAAKEVSEELRVDTPPAKECAADSGMSLKTSPALLIYPFPSTSAAISRGLNSGVILLAHELVSHGQQDGSQFKAFQFPPDELDVEYHTNPEGLNSENDNISHGGDSFVLTVLQDEQVREMIESPERLMDDIQRAVDDVKSKK